MTARGEGFEMANRESETGLKARIDDAVISGGPGLVIFAIVVAAQIGVGALGVILWLIKALWAVV